MHIAVEVIFTEEELLYLMMCWNEMRKSNPADYAMHMALATFVREKLQRALEESDEQEIH